MLKYTSKARTGPATSPQTVAVNSFYQCHSMLYRSLLSKYKERNLGPATSALVVVEKSFCRSRIVCDVLLLTVDLIPTVQYHILGPATSPHTVSE